MEGCSRWGLSNLRNLTEKSPDQSFDICFPSALRIFLPLCKGHFTINDMYQLTVNYPRLTKPAGSLISKRIITAHLLITNGFELFLE